MSDPFYRTEKWRKLRLACLRRDRYVCFVPGCPERAVVADHIKRREDGGEDVLQNLRSCCSTHHNQAHREKRTGDGHRIERFTVKGAAADGAPIDPRHPWNK